MNLSLPAIIATAVLATGGIILYSMNPSTPNDKKRHSKRYTKRHGGNKKHMSAYDLSDEEEPDLDDNIEDSEGESVNSDKSDETPELTEEDLDAVEYDMSDDDIPPPRKHHKK